MQMVACIAVATSVYGVDINGTTSSQSILLVTCVMHRKWRTFMLPDSPAPQSRFGNAYYHLHFPCIKFWSVWSQFDSQRHLVIPKAIAVALLPAHKQALAASFRVFLD